MEIKNHFGVDIVIASLIIGSICMIILYLIA
ncbi:hypothetical protein Clopa_3662 [Clostridium pasteurianum BC1]|uniref:Uncharacterized protein n=1 Tax=Clostridium pasteurianum BC1 TaxID=86416 RepID=R4KD20_CLOPA|nr:hypothetical protein Clopa_3662 [Clostridium pasteurianum BC1]